MGRLSTPPLLLAGCLVRAPVDDRYPEVVLTTPEIQESSVVCDVEAGRWKLSIDASSWTGGAQTAWTIDGEYVELHAMERKSWAGDGSHERLELTLPIVDDWREVDATSTVFTCAQDPSGVLELRDPDGKATDCRSWGPAPAIFEGVEGVDPCDLPVDTEL